MNILIIGGGGFLGSYLASSLLGRGHKVTVLGRNSYPKLTISIQCIKADIRNRSALMLALKDKEVVFHTASVPGIWGNYNEYYSIDVQGTENIIFACYENNVKKLVYTSSPSVVFGKSDMKNADEKTPYPDKYLCHYSKTKAKAEKLVMAANGIRGLATVCIRPHLIWGPGDPHLLPRIIERAMKRKLFRVGNGKNLVDMIYIDNAVEAHLKACEKLSLTSPIAGKCYFVSDGNPVVLWEWIESILKILKLPALTKSVSYPYAAILGLILESIYKILGIKKEPPMTRFLAAQLAKSHYFNISRAKNDFGYEPIVSQEEGMKRMFNYYHSHQAD